MCWYLLVCVKGIVYKYERPDCSFKYLGESKRSWKSRRAKHKPGVRSKIKSAIKDHAGSTGHNASMDNAVILKKGVHNSEKRTFLQAIHSVLDKKQLLKMNTKTSRILSSNRIFKLL